MKQKIKELQLKDKVTRDELQELCKLFRYTDDNVFLAWPPRVSKTRATMFMLNPEDRVLVCSNTTLIRDNWKKYFDSWEFPVAYKSICYQSLHKELNQYDVIVLDEQDLLSENYYEILTNFTPKRWIGLTGTTTYRSKLLWNKLVGKSFQWEISMDEAINWGILPKPEVICVGLSLKSDKRVHLYYKGRDKKKQNVVVQYKSKEFWDNIRRKDINLHIQCTEMEWEEILMNDYKYWMGLLEDEQTKVPKQVISNMINVLGNARKKKFADLKNRFIRKITNYFKLDDKRVIYFCNSIPQAEWLDSNYSVHSGKDSKHLIDEFNAGKISRLITVNIMDRGIDLINVDACVLIQASNSEASNKQKVSRSLLSIAPKIIILYYKGTRDQEYVEKFIKQFNPDYIQWITP